jgi:hypothetical protein
MKKNIIIAVLIVVGFLLISTTVSAHHNANHIQGPPVGDKKVTICHANGKHDMVRIVTSENAINGHFENNGTPKQGHEDDIIKVGEASCENAPVPPKECPAGTFLVSYENGDQQKPICKGEPTGCPYGDQIPVDSPKCVPPTTDTPKTETPKDPAPTPAQPEWELTPDGGMKNPETGEVFYGK